MRRCALVAAALTAGAAGAACADGPEASCRADAGRLAEGSMRAVGHDGTQQESVQMLQRAATRRAPREEPSKALQKALPLHWVHVPKCGSSFVNTVIHLPTVCDDTIPADLVVDSSMGPRFLSEFRSLYDLNAACPGLLSTGFGHNGIEDVGYAEHTGHFMIMLRQPEQRLVSAYLDMFYSSTFFGEEPAELMNPGRSWGGWAEPVLPPIEEWASKNTGCATRMLTRGGTPCGAAGGPPTAAEQAEAKQRLHEGFAFVGLTDRWELSMCLFDAMFKTGCHSWQFGSSRPSNNWGDNGGQYDVKSLKGVTDPYDGALYAEAVKIFEHKLARYNVSEATCGTCFKDAGLSLLSVVRRRDPFEDEHPAAHLVARHGPRRWA